MGWSNQRRTLGNVDGIKLANVSRDARMGLRQQLRVFGNRGAQRPQKKIHQQQTGDFPTDKVAYFNDLSSACLVGSKGIFYQSRRISAL